MTAAVSGLYWIEVEGVKYIFRNHYLTVKEVYDAVEIIRKEYGSPVVLIDHFPKDLVVRIGEASGVISSPRLPEEQRFFEFRWE